MIRMKSTILAALILVLVCAPLLAQKPSVDDRWGALNEELSRVYDRKDWPGAMSVQRVDAALHIENAARETLRTGAAFSI